jgi:hypothetical protein
LISSLGRRLQQLECRAAAAGKINSFSARILLVDAVEGLTGVLLLESGQTHDGRSLNPGGRRNGPRVAERSV